MVARGTYYDVFSKMCSISQRAELIVGISRGSCVAATVNKVPQPPSNPITPRFGDCKRGTLKYFYKRRGTFPPKSCTACDIIRRMSWYMALFKETNTYSVVPKNWILTSKNNNDNVFVKWPEIVKLYNSSMGGVDKSDQLISFYRTFIKSKKWTLRLITHAFDLVASNSWLQYKKEATELSVPKKKNIRFVTLSSTVGRLINTFYAKNSDSKEK
ncbi:hypothetical protein AGLY_014185 [Aphis glycines]|uniref:PiggyBac transposable element-derived protein domain-containing protein n=1 Tax=Aphis glycines TaxID=307491 RepID=A0A6G0T6I2_APHGL|nr:hypothetical protein AGLY_014185 [Aphis glycines]